MRLAGFITNNLDAILIDWVAFAGAQLPAAATMDEAALLDHGRLILEEIASDMHRAADSQVAGANLGLGLYVVREIARAHGGSVEVTSDHTATRFELRLPRICVRNGIA